MSLLSFNVGTAVNLFISIDEVSRQRNILWRNVVGYGSENANVMVGKKNCAIPYEGKTATAH